MAGAKGIRAGRAYVELGVSDQLAAALNAAQKKLQGFGTAVRNIGLKLTAAGGALGAPILASAKVFADVGDQLQKMSQRTGFSAEALSELGHAAQLSGTDLQTLEAAILKMHKASAAGLLGPAMAQLNPEEQFAAVADALAKITDPGQRAATAMKVFGRNGAMLLPMLQDGSKGLEAMRQRARDLGVTMSGEDATAAARLNDAFFELQTSLKHIAVTIGAAVAPVLSGLAERMARIVGGVVKWLSANRQIVISVGLAAAATTALGVALTGVGVTVSALATPLGAIIGGLLTFGSVIVTRTDAGRAAVSSLSAMFGELRKAGVGAVQGIVDSLESGNLARAVTIAGQSVKAVFDRLVSSLSQWVHTLMLPVLTFWHKVAVRTSLGLQSAFAFGRRVWAEIKSLAQQVYAYMVAAGQVIARTFSNLGQQAKWVKDWAVWKIVDNSAIGLWKRMRGTNQPAPTRPQWQGADDITAEMNRRVEAAQAERDAARESHRLLKDIVAKLTVRFADFRTLPKGGAAIVERWLFDVMVNSRKRLEQSRAAATKSIQEAAEAKKEREAAADVKRTRIRPFDRGAYDLAVMQQQIAAGAGQTTRIGAVGTFSGAAAGRIGYGSDAVDRTARAAEETARNTKQLAQKADRGRLIFE